MENTNQRRDVYAIVTERIIELLEKGVVPWKQPWTGAGIPRNYVTGKNYKGINHLLLNSLNYKHNVFLTRKQLDTLGGAVQEQEKPHIVVFWSWVQPDSESNANIQEEELLIDQYKKKRPLLRFYRVFNVSQCEGIDLECIQAIERPNSPIEACEELLKGMIEMPEIIHDKPAAYYDKVEDLINMPEMIRFVNSESYYETLFHELLHWTGHQKRLNRKEVVENNRFGTVQYSQEELCAQIGASFLSSLTGIAEGLEENSAAYIQGWLKVLKNDRKFIVIASSNAQKGVDYILNKKREVTEGPE